MNILVTGGAGYIGTHTLIELINHGDTPVVVDNLSNSSPKALHRVEEITHTTIPFYEFDIRDKDRLHTLFETHRFDAVIHFAGLKAVGESVQSPLAYYDNNVGSSLTLFAAMQKHGVKHIIFSSSATVYGTPEELPLRETSRSGVGIPNPYGYTKYVIEQILQDICTSTPDFRASILRYFNPVGAHESGRIGEDPKDTPNNLMPYIAQVAVGKIPYIHVYGNDYDTIDGTGVRDYLHVVDLAKGHVAALHNAKPGASIYNLGTGLGTSVLELITAFSQAVQRELPYKIVDRRPGDVAACYASAKKANDELGWKAEKTIEDACRDSWRWQSSNPNGYE